MDISPIVGDLCMGGFAGYAVGVAAKKVFRLATLFIGLYISSLIYLSSRGFLVVQWEKIGTSADGILSNIGSLSLSVGVLGAGSIAGFLLGWKSG